MMETENFDGFSAADLGDLKPVRRNPDKRFPFPAVRFSKYKNISRGFFNVHTQKEFNPRYFSVRVNDNFVVFKPETSRRHNCFVVFEPNSWCADKLTRSCPDLLGNAYRVYAVKGTDNFCIKRREPLQ